VAKIAKRFRGGRGAEELPISPNERRVRARGFSLRTRGFALRGQSSRTRFLYLKLHSQFSRPSKKCTQEFLQQEFLKNMYVPRRITAPFIVVPFHSVSRADAMLDKLGKDAASKKFVKAYDKYTLALCGTALVAYGMQQYFVRASATRNPIFVSSLAPIPTSSSPWTMDTRGAPRARAVR